jgi:hypothetical protein
MCIKTPSSVFILSKTPLAKCFKQFHQLVCPEQQLLQEQKVLQQVQLQGLLVNRYDQNQRQRASALPCASIKTDMFILYPPRRRPEVQQGQQRLFQPPRGMQLLQKQLHRVSLVKLPLWRRFHHFITSASSTMRLTT